MKRLLYILNILLLVTACSEHDWMKESEEPASGNKIVVGVTTSPLDISVAEEATRVKQVQDAEEIDWLIKPLKDGLDITYGKVSDDPQKKHERVAILKLTGGAPDDNDFAKDPDTQWAIYSFKYKDDGKDAIWYDNGEHYFEGMFVPDNLRYGTGVTGTGRTDLASVNTTSAPNITTDQSIATNYSYLEHYLAMPANTKIHATVGRVKLPFYHRLSRVIAYILIDPEMTTDPSHPVTLKGYKKDASGNATTTEDPATTSLRFCNVEVLTGVKDTPPTDAAKTHELTPQWDSKRKVIPHFEAEEGSMVQNSTGNFEEKDADFYMFYDDKTQEYIFPTMDKWMTYYNTYKNASEETLAAAKVTRTKYGKVPVYDLIVRPTYTDVNMVMYDEHNASDAPLTDSDKQALVIKNNKIDFELTLSNGLIYTKEFKFDLNTNEQTVVYLRISRESVDYNASGSELWRNTIKEDDWYGIDNQGGHSLSKAGSSWQRAYTYSATVSSDKVTDGGFYNENTVGEDGTVGQYVTLETWKKKFAQAYEGGDCHGDYFILTSNISISAKELPDNFVFTGHLDARGNTITIIETGQAWTEYPVTTDYTISPLFEDQNGTEFVMPTLYTQVHHDAVYYSADDLTPIYSNGTSIDDGSTPQTYVTQTLNHVEAQPEVYYTSAEVEEENNKHLTTDSNGRSPGDDGYETTYDNGYTPLTTNDVKTPAVPEHYEVTASSIPATTETIKVSAYDEYFEATELTVTTMMTSGITYYTRTGTEEPYTYTVYDKPTALYKKVDHLSGSSLFAGLDGRYTAAEGVANVHTEGDVMVPYTDGTTGWRAEVMNLKVNGLLFPESVYGITTDSDGNPIHSRTAGYDTTSSPRPVSGNVQNCYDGATGETKVPDHTPALFRYN